MPKVHQYGESSAYLYREPNDLMCQIGWMLFSTIEDRVSEKNKIDTWWISGESGEGVVRNGLRE